MSAIIPNITSYSTPNPTPHTDASQFSFSQSSSPYQHVGVTMSDPTNAVLLTSRQPENSLPFHCEVCNISCYTKEVLDVHKQGKKHLKKVEKLADPSASSPNTVPQPVASETLAGELENKKQRLLQNGAAAETLLYCDICKVICNNQEGFQQHVASKKHSAKSIIQQAGTSVVFDATSDFSGGSQKKPTPFSCDICNIFCTSDELLQAHKAGKKHLKKVKDSGQIPNLPLPVTPIASHDIPPTKHVVTPETNEVDTVNLIGDTLPNNLPLTPNASQDAPPTNAMANPESNEVDIFNLIGNTLPNNLPLTPIASQDAPPTNAMANLESGEGKTNLIGVKPSIASPDTPATNPVVNPESNGGKTANLHVCELCGISCDTEEVLKCHLSGKKHRKNLEKSEKSIGPIPAGTIESAETPNVIGPLQEEGGIVGSKRKGKKGGGDDDVEAKKQRILQSGTASDNVQVCTLCNVVCNSPKVFITHLAGQKHAAMAAKQAEAQASAAGQES